MKRNLAVKTFLDRKKHNEASSVMDWPPQILTLKFIRNLFLSYYLYLNLLIRFAIFLPKGVATTKKQVDGVFSSLRHAGGRHGHLS